MSTFQINIRITVLLAKLPGLPLPSLPFPILPLPTLPTPPKNGCRIYHCQIFRLPNFPLPSLPLPTLPRIDHTHATTDVRPHTCYNRPTTTHMLQETYDHTHMLTDLQPHVLQLRTSMLYHPIHSNTGQCQRALENHASAHKSSIPKSAHK